MARSVQLLNDEKNYRFLALLSDDTKFEIEKLSAFERFALLCDNMENARGSTLRREFIDALSLDLGTDFDVAALAERKCQKAIWRRINGDADAKVDIAKKCTVLPFTRPCAIDRSSPVLLDLLLNDESCRENSLEDFITKTAEYRDIYLDMTDFVYVRPDEYHARVVFDCLKLGEKCSREALSLLKSWVICRVVMLKNANLYFGLGEDVEQLRMLLSLLSERKLFPKIKICFCDIDASHNVSRMCLEARQKNISPEIISRETSVNDILLLVKALSQELPNSKISLCTFLSDAGAEERFYEAIDNFIKAEEEK